MNYIQRLLDSAAPPAVSLPMPVAPPTVATSPVIAADQRLALFSGLTPDPGPAIAAPEPTAATSAPFAAEYRSPSPEVAAPPPDAAPPRQKPFRRVPPASATAGRPASFSADDPDGVAPQREVRPPPGSSPQPSAISPLQRLVESDPLPRRVAAVPSAPVASTRPPLPAPPQAAPASSPEARPQPSPPQELRPFAPSYSNPATITPDQFTPRAPEAIPAAPPVRRAHPLDEAAPAPDPTPEPPPPSRVAAPLEPAADRGPSIFARRSGSTFDVPPWPGRPDSVQPRPERIIERIREVPVAPPEPPTPMTAAAQSVIGPLGQRRSGGWQPRQEGV
jgi:hypothetical protein